VWRVVWDHVWRGSLRWRSKRCERVVMAEVGRLYVILCGAGRLIWVRVRQRGKERVDECRMIGCVREVSGAGGGHIGRVGG
jgi:hypothetical protein